MALSAAQRRKKQIDNLHLMEGMEFTEDYGMPILPPFTGCIDDLELIPFSSRNDKSITPNTAICFFEDDYKFTHAVWEGLDRTTYRLRDYTTLLTPDYSLYVDVPKQYNLDKIYKCRFAGAYWVNCGYGVLPTASWGSVDSFKYCFNGLPKHSVIAVCGIGIDWCKPATELWEMGIRELINQIEPTTIIVYGRERTVPGVSTPMLFIPPYVKSKFKK